MKLDLILAAVIAALPWFSMNAALPWLAVNTTEPVRLGFLAAVYLVAAVLGRYRVIRGPVATLAVGTTMLAIAWLQTFPAGNHSAEIGTYLVSGTILVALASFRAARGSQNGLSRVPA